MIRKNPARSLAVLLVAVAAFAFAIALSLPGTVLASGDQANGPIVSSAPCPSVEYVDDVPVIPEGAPVDCVYIQGGLIDGSSESARFSASFTQIVTGDSLGRYLFTVERGSIELSDGSLTVTVGCNTSYAEATLLPGEPGRLILDGPITTTKMFCEGLMDAEAALISVLEGQNLTLIDDGISSSNGMIRIEGGVSVERSISSEPVVEGTPPTAGGSPAPADLPLGLIALFAAFAGFGGYLLIRRRRPVSNG